MIWVAVFTALMALMFVLTQARVGSVISINTLLSGVWLLAVLLSTCANKSLLAPSDQIFGLAFIGVLSFNVVYLVGVRPNTGPIGIWNTEPLLLVRSRVFAVEALALALFAPIAFQASQVLFETGFDLSAARSWFFFEQSFNSPFASFAFRVLPVALMTFVNAVGAINIARGDRQFLIASLFNLAALAILIGDRTALFAFLAFLVAGGLFTKIGRARNRSVRGLVIAIVVTGMVTVVSLLRFGGSRSLVTQGSEYFGGGLSFLELILQRPDQFGFVSPGMHGYLTFGFLTEPLVLAGKALGITGADVPSYHFNVFAQPFQDIGITVSQYYNNNTTALYVFMRDFGLAGPVVGFAALAVLVLLTERLVARHRWIGWRITYALLCYVVLNTPMYYSAMTSVWVIAVLASCWAGAGATQPNAAARRRQTSEGSPSGLVETGPRVVG